LEAATNAAFLRAEKERLNAAAPERVQQRGKAPNIRRALAKAQFKGGLKMKSECCAGCSSEEIWKFQPQVIIKEQLTIISYYG